MSTTKAQPGTLDLTFGDEGVAELEVVDHFDVSVRRITLDSENRIVVFGTSEFLFESSTDFLIARYLKDGTPDLTFGEQTGFLAIPWSPGQSDFANGMGIQSGGRIVLTGQTSKSGQDENCLVAGRLLGANGAPDLTFGPDPQESVFPLFSSPGAVQFVDGIFNGPVHVDALDQISIAGRFGANVNLIRLQSDGIPDPDFGNAGILSLSNFSMLGFEYPSAICKDDADEVYVAANIFYFDPNQNPDLVQRGIVFKISATGEVLDYGQANNNEFGQLDFLENSYTIFDIEVRNGKCFVCGIHGNLWFDPGRGFVACFDEHGLPDLSFGEQGIFELEQERTVLRRLAFDSTGKLVAGGSRALDGVLASVPVAVRLDSNGRPDCTFGDNGVSDLEFVVGSISDVAIGADDHIYFAGDQSSGIFATRVLGGNAFLLGDVNDDQAVDLLDVGPFVEVLISSGFDPAADANCDGAVDLLDVGPFVDLLL